MLVSDNAIDTGKVTKTGVSRIYGDGKEDKGSFSRYFSLDAWWQAKDYAFPTVLVEQLGELPIEAQNTFPYIVVPKPSTKEKDAGLEKFQYKDKPVLTGAKRPVSQKKITSGKKDKNRQNQVTRIKNDQPTVKPIMLGSYLCIIGSRGNQLVLDPFAGSGTFGCSALLTNRSYVCMEKEHEYAEIARARIEYWKKKARSDSPLRVGALPGGQKQVKLF